MTNPTHEYFIAHGADPAVAAELAQQAALMSGSPQVRGELQDRLTALPPSVPGGPAVASDRAAHFQSLGVDEATAQRLALEEAAHIHGTPDAVMARRWEEDKQIAADITAQNEAATEQKFATLLDEQMKPPDSPMHYDIPRPHRDLTSEEMEADTAGREAMLAAGLPKFIGDVVAERMTRTAEALQEATPEQVQMHVEAARTELRHLWGAHFQSRLDVVDAFVAAVASKSPFVARILDAAPHLFAEATVMESLYLVASKAVDKFGD